MKVGQVGPSAMVALLLVMGIASPAWAKRDLRGFVTIGAGIADDPRAVTGADVGGGSDGFLTLRPGVLYVDRTAAHEHKVSLLVAATQHPGSSGGNSISQNLAFSSQLTGWKRASLELEGSGSYGLVNQSAPLTEEQEEFLGLAPEGQIQYVSAFGGESLSLYLSEGFSLYQGLSGGVFTPLRGKTVDRHNVIAEHSLGANYEMQENIASLELGLGYESQTVSRFDPTMFPAGDAQYGTLMAGWSRDLSVAWGIDLSAGAYGAQESSHAGRSYGPAGRAAVRYLARWFKAGLAYDHRVWPSVVLGGIMVGDRGALRIGGTFGNNEMFRLRGSVMYQRVRTLGTPDADPVGMFLGRVALGVRMFPGRHTELNLSYRLRAQTGGRLGVRELGSYERHIIMLAVTAGFPNWGVEEERIGK
jgi:hypothetical protein